MTSRKWMIVKGEGQFWNNHVGWCDERHLASDFDVEQRKTCILPPEGSWREMVTQDREPS